jgi:hypothetical protein
MMAPRFLTPKLTRCLALAFERLRLPDAVSLPGFRPAFEIEGQDAMNVDFENYHSRPGLVPNTWLTPCFPGPYFLRFRNAGKTLTRSCPQRPQCHSSRLKAPLGYPKRRASHGSAL